MKCLIFLSLILLTTTVKAQTKKETEAWIIEKLNKYGQDLLFTGAGISGKDHSKKYGYTYRFDTSYLIIGYTEKTTSFGKDFIYSCFEKIPVYDFKTITSNSTQTIIYIQTNKETIIHSCESTQRLVFDICSLGFSLKAETDLSDRLNRAFSHLKKFFKKPPTNEAF